MGDPNQQQNNQQNNQQSNGQQNNQQQNNGQQNNQQQSNQQTTKTWDEVLKELPAETKALYEQHITGLKNTVQATRDERKTLEDQLKDLKSKAEKDSDLEKSLNETLKKMEASNKRADFVEQAIKPEIGCRNIKTAYAVALQYDLYKKNGDPDWEAIKKETPESFGALIPDGEGGNGTGGEIKTPQTDAEFNAELRRRINKRR